MMIKNIIFAALALSAIAGCTAESDNADSGETRETSIIDVQIDAIKKAQSVEKTLQDSFNERDKLMDAQGQ